MLLISPSDFHTFDHTSSPPLRDGLDSWEITLYAMIPVVLAIGGLLYTRFRNGGEFWKETGFPANFKYSEKNYAKVLVAFGCVIAYREEKYAIREKLSWMRNYLNKDHDEVLGSYESIIAQGINIQKLVAWTNKYLDKTKKIYLLEFVIQLAHTDGFINSREAELIFYLLRKLNIDINLLDESVRKLLIEEKRSETVIQKENKTYYLNILGISEDATLTQLKSAYRKLVKIHHPDNHRQASETEKKRHVVTFLEVQQAYEILASEINGQ
jgi:DnaJ like chaperone protein